MVSHVNVIMFKVILVKVSMGKVSLTVVRLILTRMTCLSGKFSMIKVSLVKVSLVTVRKRIPSPLSFKVFLNWNLTVLNRMQDNYYPSKSQELNGFIVYSNQHTY